jgi:hypothetical protein
MTPDIGAIIGPEDAQLDPSRGLAVIDVDEVIALFIAGFDRFLRPHGFEFRLQGYGLLDNIYPLGEKVATDKDQARGLFDRFFSHGCGEIDPAPGAVEGLAALADLATVVILTNAPEAARGLRGDWLRRHGMPYPMIINQGPKGPAVRILAGRVQGPVLFVDDLISNLDSVAESAPDVSRVQMVADRALRVVAPTSPNHRRIDDWGDLVRHAREAVFA